MSKHLLILYSCLLLMFSCQSPSPQAPLGDTAIKNLEARIDSVAEHFLQTGEIAGFSIAALQGEDTLYAKGFGYSDWEQKKPVSKETIFAMASITKLHTAVATLILVDEGKLLLDQTLQEALPDFPRPEQGRKITLRHLLSHTSGLEDYAEYMDSLYIQESIFPMQKDYFDFFEKNELKFEPGTQFSYSNSGFILMGMIIEKASGMLYEDFIEQKIAQPLGLTSLKHLNRQDRESVARRYDLQDSGFVYSLMDTTYYFKGDGGLSATALDLARIPFGIADGKLISPASVKALMDPTIFPNGGRSDYGLGFRQGTFEGRRVWGHTGGHINYWSTLAYFPDSRTGIVVFGNTDGSDVDALLIIGRVALEVFNIKEPDLAALRQETDLSRYMGEYSSIDEAYYKDPPLLMRTYEDDPGFLYRTRKNSDSKGGRLVYLGDYTFAPERFPMDRVVFEVKEGQVIGFRDYYNGLYFQRRNKLE